MRASSHPLIKLPGAHTNQRHWISNDKTVEDDEIVIVIKTNILLSISIIAAALS